jgi:hypothetical protein
MSSEATKPRHAPVYIRVLVLKQGDQWLAQGLECDIAAQGPSDQLAINSFIRILRARLARDHNSGREPLAGLPRAPERFEATWNRLVARGHLVTEAVAIPDDDPVPVPDAYVISQIARNTGEVASC